MAHVAGLVAAGVYPSPVPYADVVTTTTHKTLRGPRGGLILARANDEITKKLNSLIFPGTQGGPLMHVIAAKAVAFLEALQPEFKGYQQQVVANARAMAPALHGPRLQDRLGRHRQPPVPGRPDRASSVTGKDADAALGRANITVNKNTVPNDPRSPFVTSGLRIGTPAVTTRGFREAEVAQLAGWIADVLDDVANEAVDRAHAPVGARDLPPVPGLRLTPRLPSLLRCTARSARTRRRRSSTRASRPRASRCGGGASACSAASASRRSSRPSS